MRHVTRSSILCGVTLFLYAALWLIPCPGWLGKTCEATIGIGFFAVLPALLLLTIIFAMFDLLKKEHLVQALSTLAVSIALSIWLWRNPIG